MLLRLTTALLLLLTTSAWSQVPNSFDRAAQRPTLGGTAGVTIPPNPAGSLIQRHKNPDGSLCLQVSGVARPLGASDKLFDHWVYVKNGCSLGIRLQVCYYATTSCIDMNVPGRDRKEAILGTLPMIKDFRYEYRERF
ncbi:MAG: hypothetical protein ABWY18_18510 [Tardiphaga sp.]